MSIKTLMDTACNWCRITKNIQNICHNTWSVSTTCQENKMAEFCYTKFNKINVWTWTGSVRLMVGTGGLTCDQSSVTIDQINGG